MEECKTKLDRLTLNAFERRYFELSDNTAAIGVAVLPPKRRANRSAASAAVLSWIGDGLMEKMKEKAESWNCELGEKSFEHEVR